MPNPDPSPSNDETDKSSAAATIRMSDSLQAALARHGWTKDGTHADRLKAGAALIKHEGLSSFDLRNPADQIAAQLYVHTESTMKTIPVPTIPPDPAFVDDPRSGLEIFQEGRYVHPTMGCRARDWYIVMRTCVPSASLLTDGTESPVTPGFIVHDGATAAWIHTKALLSREPSAEQLAAIMTATFEKHGKPHKGIILHPAVWDANVGNVEDHGVDGHLNDKMPLAEKVAFENWVQSQGLACSFHAAPLIGGACVDSHASESLQFE